MTKDEKPGSAARAEIIAASALALNVATLIFGLGVLWAEVKENTRVNSAQEDKLDKLIPSVARIEENVEFLAEAERDRRQMERSKTNR